MIDIYKGNITDKHKKYSEHSKKNLKERKTMIVILKKSSRVFVISSWNDRFQRPRK